MKFIHITEASYAGGQKRHPGYYAIDESEPENTKIIGPFAVAADIDKYIEYINNKYGKDVSLTLAKGVVMSPKEHERDIDEFHKWMFSET